MQLTPTKLGIAVLLAFSSIGIAVGIPQVLCGGPPSVTCIMRPKTKDCILKLYKLDPFPWPLLKQSDPVPETANFDFTIHGYDGPGEYLCSVVCPDGNATKYTKIDSDGNVVTPPRLELTTGTYPNPLMEGFTNPPSTAQPTNLPANTQSSTDQESSTTGGPPTTFLQYLTSATNPPNTAQPTTSPATAQPTTVQDPWTGTTPPPSTAPSYFTTSNTPFLTTPAQTTPAQTTPVQTTPAQTTPGQTTPAQTTPAQTTPATTEPPPDPCKEAKGDVSCVRQNGRCVNQTGGSCEPGTYPASKQPQLCDCKKRLCCVPTNSGGEKTCGARNGNCQNATEISCPGYYETGLCNGLLDIQCCLPFCRN